MCEWWRLAWAGPVRLMAVWLSAGVAICLVEAAAAEGVARAADLMKNRQYHDAIKVLKDSLSGSPDAEMARAQLLLGECYFLTKQFDLARPAFVQAAQHARDDAVRTAAEYRLAIVAYRLKDYAGARARMEAFAAKYPGDARLGKLLGYQMLMLAAQGARAEPELVALHARIHSGQYDAETRLEADEILCDFHRQTGQPEKAVAAYTRIVTNFRRVVADYERDKRPLPADMERAHDHAALQLGVLALERKQLSEAVKWLENVRYDQEAKQKARLFLAKTAYDKQDFGRAIGYLTDQGFLDTVPGGPLKSDMCLLLGLSEKARPEANPGRVENWLKQVGPEAKGYAQAQVALGDLYREKGLWEAALKAFGNATSASDHAPHALLALGQIHLAQADQAAEPARAEAARRKAADCFGQLLAQYSLAPEAKAAREAAAALAEKGVMFATGAGGDELLAVWQKTARDRAGSAEAAQACLSLARHHARKVVEENTGQWIKAPDYAAVVAACDRLLEEKVYAGQGFPEEAWRAIKAEALQLRGEAELASVGRPSPSRGTGAAPILVKAASAERAAEFFRSARTLADPKQLELVKQLELGLVEAMFKSDRREIREAAEQRFGELEADYGNDARFQRLALELAEWHREQGRWAEAGRQYLGVANRGKDWPETELLKILYTAGSLFSKAGLEALRQRGAADFALYIYPKETIVLGDHLLKSHRPLLKLVELNWPRPELTAREALLTLSKTAQIPFVWAEGMADERPKPKVRKPKEEEPAGGAPTPLDVAVYLDSTRLRLKSGKMTGAEALEQILDLKVHKLAFDLGIAGGKPTLDLPPGDDPEVERPKVIEIYDARLGENRYRPLTRPFGNLERRDAGKRERGREAGIMLFNLLERIEAVTHTRVVWADGLDKQEKLAAQCALPSADQSCGTVLGGALDPLQLRFRVIRREAAAEHFDAAKDAFNKVRQIDPKSKYGERALFAMAMNFYSSEDYPKMKAVLREYLKLFDSAAGEYYHTACFWVGWALERERKGREAIPWYERAAAERLVVTARPPAAPPGTSPPPPTREARLQQLGYDSQFALLEPVAGEWKSATLEELMDFIRLNTHVSLRSEVSPTAVTNTLTHPPFKGVPAFSVWCDALDTLGLTFRVENIAPEMAERAYYRLAMVYRKDNLMDQALEHCRALLARYPATPHRRDAQTLMLDIYKGLRDYRQVLATLDELKRSATDEAEQRRLEAETAWIWFDLADYPQAATVFKSCLGAARETGEQLALRDGLAKALFRAGEGDKALAQFELLEREETHPLRQYVAGLMSFYLKLAQGKAFEREFPEPAQRFLQQYERLTDAERNSLSAMDHAKAAWTYYVMGLVDLKKDRPAAALEKFKAASASPDDFLAAEASWRLAEVHLLAREWDQAREALEYLLFATKSSEAAVRATYALGLCLQELGRPENARARFEQLLERWPLSPFAARAKPAMAAKPSRTNGPTQAAPPEAKTP